MLDYILEIVYDPADAVLEELILTRLFLTASTGSSSSNNVISAYFDSPEEREAAGGAFDGMDVDLHRVDRERVDWLERYEQSLEPLFIGETFVVAPDARLIPADTTRHRLVIPQEHAFGTGSHESTALCIAILETLDLRGKRGLDIGAGSGILALAMCRLGAEKVIAFDNDVDAYAALRENRMRNGVDAARMPLFIGGVDALRAGRFDVVTMNILPEVIVPLLPEVAGHMTGTLILSGILTVLRGGVVDACARQRLSLRSERTRGEWWAGSFTL